MTDFNKEDALIFPKNNNEVPSGTFIEPNKYFANTVGGKKMTKCIKNGKSKKNTCKHRFVRTSKSKKCIKCEYRKIVRKLTRKNRK